MTIPTFVTALLLAALFAAPSSAAARTPTAGATIVLVEPDIRLALLRSTAQTVPRADWSAAARAHVGLHARNALLSGGRTVETLSRADLSPEARQILLLYDAVRASIKIADAGDSPPATLSRRRSWTLGAGARVLGAGTTATLALIITADGDVTSSARAVYVVGAAAMGILASTGLQRASAALVDLETGDIVWRNSIVASPDQDMRDPEGAHRLVTALLKGAPL